MKTFGSVLIQTFRFLVVPVAVWQVLHLLQAFDMRKYVDFSTPVIVIKLIVLAACLIVFFGLKPVTTRLKPQGKGVSGVDAT